MNKQLLKDTIQQRFAGNNGLLAMDETTALATNALPQQAFRKPLKYGAGSVN